MIKLSQIIILNVPKREREGKYLKKLIETSAKPFGIEVSISMNCAVISFALLVSVEGASVCSTTSSATFLFVFTAILNVSF